MFIKGLGFLSVIFLCFIFPPLIFFILFICIFVVTDFLFGSKTSIDIVMGKTGAGKTTYLATQVHRYLKKGYTVYSNIEIPGTYVLSLEDLGVYELEKALVILDEAGFGLNSRDWKNFGASKYHFFTKHRKKRLKIILAVQFWDRLDIVIRELVHNIYIVQPLNFPLSFLNKYILWVREVSNDIDINEQSQIYQKFYFLPFLSGGSKFYLRSKYYKYFDTFEVEELPHKNFEMWGELDEESDYNILQKIKKYFSSGKQ